MVDAFSSEHNKALKLLRTLEKETCDIEGVQMRNVREHGSLGGNLVLLFGSLGQILRATIE